MEKENKMEKNFLILLIAGILIVIGIIVSLYLPEWGIYLLGIATGLSVSIWFGSKK